MRVSGKLKMQSLEETWEDGEETGSSFKYWKGYHLENKLNWSMHSMSRPWIK